MGRLKSIAVYLLKGLLLAIVILALGWLVIYFGLPWATGGS